MSCRNIKELSQHDGHTITLSKGKDKVVIECQTCWETLLEITDESEKIFVCSNKKTEQEN